MKCKNKEKFSEKQAWPDRLDGSYVTYGWVLIFSTWVQYIIQHGSTIFTGPLRHFDAAICKNCMFLEV